jgi:hypothetical protein
MMTSTGLKLDGSRRDEDEGAGRDGEEESSPTAGRALIAAAWRSTGRGRASATRAAVASRYAGHGAH